MSVSKWDDYLLHQVAQPMDHLGTNSPHFMDRLWFMSYTDDGSMQLMAGLGVYPNLNVMDGFLLVRMGGIQRNLRVSRHLQGPGDRANAVIGPLAFEILEPQKLWRIALAENDYGVGCDLEFAGRMPPYLYPRLDFKDQEQLHYKQPGRCKGSITFEGRKYPVADMASVRDRSWGFRKPGIISGFNVLVVAEAHFDDGGASLIYFDNLGETFAMRQGALLGDDGSVNEIVQMRQKIEFETGTRQFRKVELELADARGKKHQLSATAIAPPCFFSGGGYDGRHGLDRGPLNIEGERWDVSRDADAAAVFPYYSRIVRFDLDGRPGIGHIEAFFNQDKDWVYKPTWTT